MSEVLAKKCENSVRSSAVNENSWEAGKENRPASADAFLTPKGAGSRKRSHDGASKHVSKRCIIESYTQEVVINGECVYRCVLEDGCDYLQKVFRPSNFERHFRLCHPMAYDLLNIGPLAGKSTSPNTEPAITIRMTVQRLLGGIVKMVTIHGLPFEATEWEGFQEVVGPLLKAYNLTINRHNITKYVSKAAEGINFMISQELKGKMFSLKLDIVSKMYRSMLGINCQYINNSGVVVKRNLGEFISYLFMFYYCTGLIASHFIKRNSFYSVMIIFLKVFFESI